MNKEFTLPIRAILASVSDEYTILKMLNQSKPKISQCGVDSERLLLLCLLMPNSASVGVAIQTNKNKMLFTAIFDVK